MALNIKSERADRLARELAEATGETITEAVTAALEARLDTVRRRRAPVSLGDITERFAALPVVDDRPADEILGYDDVGLPA